MTNYAVAAHPYAGPAVDPAGHEPDSTSHTPEADDASKKRKTTKRRKVNHACLYCRRSHMTCDEGRPCQRCIKREIGHLCHDEQRPSKTGGKQSSDAIPTGSSNGLDPARSMAQPIYGSTMPPPATTAWPMSVPSGAFLYQPETLGNEFSVLTDFLETLDEGSFFTTSPAVTPSLMPAPAFSQATPYISNSASAAETTSNSPAQPPEAPAEEPTPPLLPSATKTENKYEAGLLKPYDYVKGYARLSRWMDRNVSRQSKQQILQPLSVLRPKFRAVAQSLRDIDLVFIEEAFERLLLDYDRVFSAMGVPACLWRRTGEIYKGNREFSELVGVDGYMMRDGRLCIYELMAEESAVNYWEKYGHVAFDSSQKAVLTSCVLRYKPLINTQSQTPKKEDVPNEEGFVNCCFSFTIRRDKWGIPSMIVGNFIKC
ncbi:uncharacterized protein EDB93DRAFT_1252514 [Suillus bovinus]|uniref:uncharacterized protein n=1 Tax=Suillus bovinus TaxID=48563 RepID=UPI001B87A649|nr:uncharacterized protein EDB93DRAFT_1252514 [Suillus bovinus]KAG2141375.1 hypothetical protein EDB93DRAFT_1252514 [Suillus bovinus]